MEDMDILKHYNNLKTIQYNIGQDNIYNYKNIKANKTPIYKGCLNKQCYCTGKCKEIIGWRDKLPNEL